MWFYLEFSQCPPPTYCRNDLRSGDILLTPEEIDDALWQCEERNGMPPSAEIPKAREKRKAVSNPSKIWDLPIDYTFDDDNRHSQTEEDIIKSIITEWESVTCIQFREGENSPHHQPLLVFSKQNGCASHVGRYTGQTRHNTQMVYFGSSCFVNLDILRHELGHVFGLFHEQSRPDRDSYVTILTENVQPHMLSQFAPKSSSEANTYGIPYNMGSIMHYPYNMYGKLTLDEDNVLHSRQTIQAKDPFLQRSMGRSTGIQFLDAKAVNAMYCKDKCTGSGLRCSNGGYPNPSNAVACSACLCPDGLAGQTCDTVLPSIGQRCGGVLQATWEEQTINSPGYDVAMRVGNRYKDTPYERWQQCNWLIKAPAGQTISVYFKGPIFNVAAYANGMCNDYVEVRYGESIGTSGARFCGSEIPVHEMTTASNLASVLFRASEREWPIDRVGFKLAYKIHGQPSSNRQTFNALLRNENLGDYLGIKFEHSAVHVSPNKLSWNVNPLAYINSLLWQ